MSSTSYSLSTSRLPVSSDSIRATSSRVALEQVGDAEQQVAALAARGAAATGPSWKASCAAAIAASVSSGPASSTSATRVPSAGQRISRRAPERADAHAPPR